MISSAGSTLVRLCDNTKTVGFKLAGNRQRAIGGSVINDDDLLPRPRLGDRRLKRLSDPFLRVEGGDEN